MFTSNHRFYVRTF